MKKRTISRALRDIINTLFTVHLSIECNSGEISDTEFRGLSISSPDPETCDLIFICPILTLHQRFGVTAIIRMVSNVVLNYEWTKGVGLGVDTLVFGDLTASGNLFGTFEDSYKKKENPPFGIIIKYISGEISCYPYYSSVVDVFARIPEEWWKEGLVYEYPKVSRELINSLLKDLTERKEMKELIQIVNEAYKRRKI